MATTFTPAPYLTQDHAQRVAARARWIRRAQEWPTSLACPARCGRAAWTSRGAHGIRYQCTRCQLLFVVPMAQIDKRSIRFALDLGPVAK